MATVIPGHIDNAARGRTLLDASERIAVPGGAVRTFEANGMEHAIFVMSGNGDFRSAAACAADTTGSFLTIEWGHRCNCMPRRTPSSTAPPAR